MSNQLLQCTHGMRARYSFKSIIVGTTNESATMLFMALSSICSLIVGVYRFLLDETNSKSDKREELAKFRVIEPYLEDVLEFCSIEMTCCKVKGRKVKMEALIQKLEVQRDQISANLKLEILDVNNEYVIFDSILAFLDLLMSFLDQRHAVEKERLCACAEDIVVYANAARIANDEKVLIAEGRQLIQSCLDLLRSTKQLVSAQANVNPSLRPRFYVINNLMQAALPNYLKICREKIRLHNSSTIFRQNTCFMQLCSILNELKVVVTSIQSRNQSLIEVLPPAPSSSEETSPVRLCSPTENLFAMLKGLEFKVDPKFKKSDLKSLVENLTKSLDMDGDQKVGFEIALRDSIVKTRSMDTHVEVGCDRSRSAGEGRDLLEMTRSALKALKRMSGVLVDEAPSSVA